LKTLRIATHLWLIVGLSFSLFFVAIGVGLYGIKTAANALQTVYEDRAVPMETLSGLAAILRENRADVFRLYQHDPAKSVATLHSHPAETHLLTIAQRVTAGDALWQSYLATRLTAEEQLLVADFTQKRATWLAYLQTALDAIKVGDFSNKAVAAFSDTGNQAYEDALKALDKLRVFQVTVAKQEFTEAEARYQNSLIIFLALAILGGAGLAFSARFALRRINNGLYEARTVAQAIAIGNFSAPLPPASPDEIGELMAHISTMRDGLLDLVGSLRSSEVRSSAILRTMRDGVVHIDAHGKILLVNDVIADLFGYDEDELLGQNVSLLMPEPDRSAHDGYLARYLTTRQPRIVGLSRREVDGQRKDGSRFDMELSINEMVDDAGSTFLGIIRDITERKAAQQELEVALTTAKAALEVKGRFLANMSHEIRTPINAILGFSDLCRRLELPVRGRDYLDKIHSSANSLLGVINDILDFSKIEANRLEMESIPFSLGEVLHGMASLFNIRARTKGIELAIGAQPDVPDRLVGDPMRLGQILTNLVGNALKFTEHGEVDLTVEMAGGATLANGNMVTLRFMVRDTGLGMSPEQLALLFNPFTQADNSITRKFGGTGLGLTISKQLVELMGGEITVESVAGEGSRFSFTARFGLATGESARTPARSPIADKRVLVVDDNAVMRILLSKSVEAFGGQVEVASTGQEALHRLQPGADSGDTIDLILLDWRMPDLDGLTVARRIRATGNPVPIIMVTGDDPELARSESEDDDIQAFLAKPVNRSFLHDTMVSVLGGHAVLPPLAIKPSELPVLTGKRILLVDDNDFNRQVGRELIELTGATVATADDGAQAVAAVDAGAYDLVLMDLQMPEMDGYTAARIIRIHRPDLPILALTAHAMVEEKARVVDAGMKDILTKPILPDILYAMLAHWLTGITPVAAAPIDTVAPAIAVPPAPTFPEAAQGFDLATALARVNGNSKMLERFLRLFYERNAGIVDQIGAALAQQDNVTARRLAHTLKGGAGTIGMVDVQAAAAKLEGALVASLKEATPANHDCAEDFAALEVVWASALKTLAALLDSAAAHLQQTTSGDS
jgi:two-component system, sensor histidine kinase and response regulator